MRGAFGLVSLLVTAAIVAYLWSMYVPAVQQQTKPLQEKAERLQGQTIAESIKLEDSTDGKYVLVKSIVPGGDMEKFYGLKPDDRIIEIDTFGPVSILGGKDGVLQYAAQSRKLVVMRGGQRLVLPADDAPPPQPMGQPQPTPRTGGDPLAPLRGKFQTP